LGILKRETNKGVLKKKDPEKSLSDVYENGRWSSVCEESRRRREAAARRGWQDYLFA
jgi:hypothetical protein